MTLLHDPAREQQELRSYLGANYDHRKLEQWDRQVERELAQIGDERLLYRTSEAYLYNLTAFAMSGVKDPYLAKLTDWVAPPASLLDYGCGIGSDGLSLLEAGYRVSFADFDNPSTRYLRWRLERRGLSAPVYDLDAGELPGGFDLAYSFDVIEHVDDPFAFLHELELRARSVLVNLLEPVPGETELHRPLPVADLLSYARAQGLKRYRLYHGRSHLMLYRPGHRSGLIAGVRAWRAINRLRRGPASARRARPR